MAQSVVIVVVVVVAALDLDLGFDDSAFQFGSFA